MDCTRTLLYGVSRRHHARTVSLSLFVLQTMLLMHAYSCCMCILDSCQRTARPTWSAWITTLLARHRRGAGPFLQFTLS
jgi:hypothetical protein